ncbi:MAG: mechanosensitive ion channel domain-containing protein [Verrucomicrobiota bacterium]
MFDGMIEELRVAAGVFCLVVFFLSTVDVVAQREGSLVEIGRASVEARLEVLEADETMGEEEKAVLRKEYATALEDIALAEEYASDAASYRDAMEMAPGETERLREEIMALRRDGLEVGDEKTGTVEDVQAAFEARRAALVAERSEFASLEEEFSRVEARSNAPTERLPAARRELAELEKGLEDGEPAEDGPSRDDAARVVAAARALSLRGEIEMLEAELLSHLYRFNLLGTQRDYLAEKIEAEEGVLERLQFMAERRLEEERERVAELATQAVAEEGMDGEEGAGEWAELALEVREFSDRYAEMVEQLKLAREDQGVVDERLAKLTSEERRVREEAELGGLEGAFVEILLEQRRRLPSMRAYRAEAAARGDALTAARLEGLEIGRALEKQEELEEKTAEEASTEAVELVRARQEILDRLQRESRILVEELTLLDSLERKFVREVRLFQGFLREQLFWAKSSSMINVETFSSFPGSVWWLVKPDRWREVGGSLVRGAVGAPVRSAVVVAAIVILILMRGHLRKRVVDAGLATRRISRDHYGHTVEATGVTALIAVPFPLLIWYAGWLLTRDVNASDWLRGFAWGMQVSGWLGFALLFVIGVCRADGLGGAQFGWDEAMLAPLRRLFWSFLIVLVPSVVIAGCTLYEESAVYFDSLGRLVFMVIYLWVAFVMWRALRPATGVFSGMMEENPKGWLSRFRMVWYPLGVLTPLVLVMLAASGYVITAMALGLEFLATLGIIVAGAIVYGLVLRWFMIKEHRLALEEAIEARRVRREEARREAAIEEAQGENDDTEGAEVISIEAEEEELDLEKVGLQTRRLLRVLSVAAVLIGIWYLWVETIPSFGLLDGVAVSFLGGVSVLDLMRAAMILTITAIMTQNLPGLLEIAVLRATDIDVGTRNAITTLGRYAVTAVGLLVLFSAINLDWSKFGWIAAALSVGLGFGLQEVVANFVCGIILLFERPIRVGDVVTVDDVTGTATKIRMRATTITNWDRKEYIVPNKQFITGTLMNWTLTNTVSRIVLNVGVAYGSDTKRAQEILLAVAQDHELIMDDPAPMVSFESFGNSTLDLVLRCFLPSMDNRIRTITELHEEIDRRYREAGIEIAFPQLDVHLKGEEPLSG